MKERKFSLNRDQEMKMGCRAGENPLFIFAFVSQLQELMAKVTIRRDRSQEKIEDLSSNTMNALNLRLTV